MALRYIPVCYWCIGIYRLDGLPWWETEIEHKCRFCDAETTFVIEIDRKVDDARED